uniref:UBA domain-containing protein n=1 Tax=Ciona savignyi TaxID=51511 RepID=H2ZA75_CIOSA
MLEKYAAHVLDHYIGKYVQNFNPDNLSIGILQGSAVELEDLLLRSDALKEFDFPGLQLLWGCIGKITLNIPSYKNYNEPWVIDIHKLFLLLTPNTNSEESNEQAETQARIDFKYKQLTAREEKWNATHSSNRSIYSIWQSYSSSIATKILQNLQVRVHDVHIRYEDSTTCSSPFAFGMCIDVLSIQSTNQNWFKLVHLSNMSIYWDTKAVCFGGDLQDIKVRSYTLSESTTSSYVVNPVSSEARFTQDLSQRRLISPYNPRLTFSMELPLVSLKLNKRQYNQMLELGEEVTRWTIRHRNKSGRPIENVRNNPQEWWRWASQHHLSKIREKRRRGSWKFICRRLKMLLKYVANYRQLLKMKYVLKTQDADVSAAVCEVEEELTLDELLLLREVVYDQLNQEILAKSGGLVGGLVDWWVGQWAGWDNRMSAEDHLVKKTSIVLKNEWVNYVILNTLYEIFGEGFSEKETNESFLHRDTVFLKLNFNLCNGSISLYDDSGGDCAGVVSLEFNNLKLGSDLKPRTGTYNMRIDLENILLKDLNKSNSHYSNLVQLSDRTKLSTNTDNTRIKSTFSLFQVKKEQSVPSVFCLFYEKLPRAEQESFSDSLQVATDPLCITCVPGLMDRLKHFFTSQDHGDETDYLMSNYDSDLLSGLARKKYATWKLQTQQEISNAVKRIMQGKSVNTKKMRRWKVVLDICAPEIIIPQDISDPKGKTVIFNLGHVNVASHLEDNDDEKVVECSTPDNDSDDDFRTPLNSPPPEYSTFIDPAKSQPPTPGKLTYNGKHEVLSETMMLDKMYERFHISFSNLQVLVASNNLEWSGTQFGGSSRFHFIQPFSLNLQIDRRVVSTLDPMYPALKVSGKLPHLTLHISHLKVRTVEWCIKQFQTEISASNPPSEGEVGGKEADLWIPGSFRDDPDHAKSVQLSCDFLINQVAIFYKVKVLTASYSLFCFALTCYNNYMDNRFISVLEVNRVQTIFTKRPFDDSTELSIYSLLLVDVMQQLGKDFELLLASHRSVCLDMDSGEILDSGATSPIPSSHQLSPNLSMLDHVNDSLQFYASEYLINVHLQTHQYGSPHMVPTTTKRKTTVDAKFSNLDAVFNVKSWTKILSFLHNLIASDQPKQESWASNLINTTKKETIKSRAMKVLNDSEIHINFDFNKLNVLFLRHIYTQSKTVGRKVATATLQSARIESKESSNITVRGSVASLQVQDLTMVNHWGTRNLGSEIVNVGFVDSQRTETFCNAVATETHSFSYLQLPGDSAHEQTEQESKVSLELALICYIHSPRLVQEVLALTDEVNEAYKDMARSIIEKVSDYSKTILGQDTRSEEQMNEPHKPRKPGSKLDFVMKLRSPLIAFPKFAESYELVVANLGEITVSNNPDIDSSQSPMDRLRISIVNMNLRTHRQIEAEIENKKSGSISIGPNILMLKKSCTTSSHTSGETSDYEILHNTSLELKVDKVGPCCTEYASCMGGISDKQMCMEIHTESTTTFSLSKGTYEQILKTLDNISFGGDIDEIPTTHTQPKHSVSAPDVAFVSKLPPERRATQPNWKFEEGLLFEPSSSEDISENLVNIVQTRKYTPLKVNFRVPCLLFQLDGDLGDGQQGIVKVTIHDFEAAYDKENRFGTSFDLSLGSLDIQDLLQPEGSLNSRSSRLPPPPNYLSTSCPDVPTHPLISDTKLSTSLPAMEDPLHFPLHSMTGRHRLICTDKEDKMVDHSNVANTTHNNTLVHITAFLVDGKSVAYQKVYNRTNRNIDIDFNSLDCKVNLQTWVVLLDFFGIGTSPKKTFQIDQETEQEFPDLTQLDVKSYYENQPEDHINSDIDFTVRHFSIMLVKPEYELLKADVTNLQLHAQLKDGRMRVNGQLGGLAVSDLTPNGFLYKERFIFTGDKALDFDVIKYDDFDYKLERAYDISVKLRMASIRYVHTQRFQNETVAFCQHFQQLQEILGRMRAASVGQSVCVAARRQGRIALDIQTGPAIILIPESCHAQRLIVANLGIIIVKNEFLRNGESGTLSSYRNAMNNENTGIPDVSTLAQEHNVLFKPFDRRPTHLRFVYSNPHISHPTPIYPTQPHYIPPNPHISHPTPIYPTPTFKADLTQVVGPSTGMRSCVLDVIHVTLVDMNLFAAVHTEHQQGYVVTPEEQDTLLFPSYSVVLDQQPLLTKKVQLKLQLERNLEKEITHRGVPDTALSVELSSVVCKLDHTQYWLIRGVLDHNIGEAIPDFPQPTAFLQ